MTTIVKSSGRRIDMTAEADHKAGDLVYYKGFFGYVQDDVDSGDLGVLILGGEVTFARMALTIGPQAMGSVMEAAPTAEATTLKLYNKSWTATSIPSGVIPIGRLSATSATSTGQIILFGPANDN